VKENSGAASPDFEVSSRPSSPAGGARRGDPGDAGGVSVAAIIRRARVSIPASTARTTARSGPTASSAAGTTGRGWSACRTTAGSPAAEEETLKGTPPIHAGIHEAFISVIVEQAGAARQ